MYNTNYVRLLRLEYAKIMTHARASHVETYRETTTTTTKTTTKTTTNAKIKNVNAEGILRRRIYRCTVPHAILIISLLRRTHLSMCVILTILLLPVRLGKNSCAFGRCARILALNVQRVNS